MSERYDQGSGFGAGRSGEHPDELLAELVDGSLEPSTMQVVEDHLASCDGCRQDLALARRGREALERLRELDVPMGTTRPIVDQARGERRSRGSGRSAWWAGGAAAAAALVAVVVWVGSRAGDDTAMRAGAASEGSAAPESAARFDAKFRHIPFETSDVNYDDDKIRNLAQGLAATQDRESDDGGAPAAPSASAAPAAGGSDQVNSFSVAASPKVVSCVLEGAGVPGSADPLRIYAARYRRDPAYLAAFLEGPGAGQPPDRLLIYVVSRLPECQFRSFASQRI